MLMITPSVSGSGERRARAGGVGIAQGLLQVEQALRASRNKRD